MPNAGTQDSAWITGEGMGPGAGRAKDVRAGGGRAVGRARPDQEGLPSFGTLRASTWGLVRPLPLVTGLRTRAGAGSDCQAGAVGWGWVRGGHGQRLCVGCRQKGPQGSRPPELGRDSARPQACSGGAAGDRPVSKPRTRGQAWGEGCWGAGRCLTGGGARGAGAHQPGGRQRAAA